MTFQNVPAFAIHLDVPLEVPNLGTLTVDIAYGGMFYVIADAEALGLRLTPDEGRAIVRVGEMIKASARQKIAGIVHPENPEIHALSTAQLSGPAHDPANHLRNAVIISTGDFDWQRPDTWTGCSTDRRAAPAPARAWRPCTRAVG